MKSSPTRRETKAETRKGEFNMAIPITDEIADAIEVLASVVDKYGEKSMSCPTKRSIKLCKDVFDDPSTIKRYMILIVRDDTALMT